ncbi:hypothetical protein LWI29_005243 [Acer saccharum]|uniref:Uncharacterized protein n=1 Tax=Acer saccharum TaxID=4024 RepID=A0AA39RKC9_ACESA|nr:hypothetical protein LWI29_005243 [Acer saccharum]
MDPSEVEKTIRAITRSAQEWIKQSREDDLSDNKICSRMDPSKAEKMIRADHLGDQNGEQELDWVRGRASRQWLQVMDELLLKARDQAEECHE